MKKIHLKDGNNIICVPMDILIKQHGENIKIRLEVNYNGKEYVGVGYGEEDVFVNLQKNLPSNVTLLCCMTCAYGNLCPFGNVFGEVYCTKNNPINNKQELIELFSDEKLINNLKVLSEDYCNNFKEQNKNDYTYNDYNYLLERK